MPHTDIRATVPEDVDIFEEIGRATGEEQLAAVPVGAVTPPERAAARPGVQPVEAVPTEARVPGAPAPPAAPVEQRADVEDMRAQIRNLIGSGRITDLIEAQRMLGSFIQEQTETAAVQAGVPRGAVARPVAPPLPPQVAALPRAPEVPTQAQAPPRPAVPVTAPAAPGPPGQPSANVLADLTKLLREAQRGGAASVPPQTTPLGGRPTLAGG